MTRLANVLIAGTDPQRLKSLADPLTASNYDSHSSLSEAAFRETARRDHPDLAIIDLASPGLNGLQLATDLGNDAETANIPVVLIGDASSPEWYTRALEVAADELFTSPRVDPEFLIRLTPLLRLSTMRAELHRRVAMARQFGILVNEGVAPEIGSEPSTILAVGPADGERALIENALEGHCSVTVSNDIFKAEDLLSESAFDACVLAVDSGSDAEATLNMCANTRNNPRLFNLPAIVLAPAGGFADTMEAYRRGATRVVNRPVQPEELRYALVTLVNRQRLRWGIHQVLVKTKQGAIHEDLSDTYTFEFLKRHLSVLIGAAHTWQKHLTLVFFSIPGISEVREQFGAAAADHLTRQLAQWIMGLVRVEDLTARYQQHDFCVALPDTPLTEARIVMNRIAGILSYTDFAVAEVYQPIIVAVEVGMAELEPDDTVETLIARARENLD